jgi:hypothetical protein
LRRGHGVFLVVVIVADAAAAGCERMCHQEQHRMWRTSRAKFEGAMNFVNIDSTGSSA